jgi:hypothetical protein
LRNGVEYASLTSLIVVLRLRRIVGVVLSKYTKTGHGRIASEIVHVCHRRNWSGGTEVSPVRLPGRNGQKRVMVVMVVETLLTAIASKFGHDVLPKLFALGYGLRGDFTRPDRIGA